MMLLLYWGADKFIIQPYIAFFERAVWQLFLPSCEPSQIENHDVRLTLFRETFENIYLDLSKQSGKCRFAESGLGWKPSGGGDTFTLDAGQIGAAQWSRASKGHELKILSRNVGVIQLDGFEQEVSKR